MTKVREDFILFVFSSWSQILNAEKLDKYKTKCPSAGEGAGNILSIICTFKKYLTQKFAQDVPLSENPNQGAHREGHSTVGTQILAQTLTQTPTLAKITF